MDGLKAMEQNRWIVVGVDFSDGSMRALDYAVKLATEVGANVACVHAYEDAASTPALDDPAPAIRRQLEDAIARSAAYSRNIRVDPVVRRGAPWDKLINVATELGAELPDRLLAKLRIEIPGYELLDKIESGGQATVYRARELTSGLTVAIKVLNGGAAADDSARDRLLREAAALRALNHPNIVCVIEAGRLK